jgi:hypothetical protein
MKVIYTEHITGALKLVVGFRSAVTARRFACHRTLRRLQKALLCFVIIFQLQACIIANYFRVTHQLRCYHKAQVASCKNLMICIKPNAVKKRKTAMYGDHFSPCVVTDVEPVVCASQSRVKLLV